jgi:hypothetical protein
MYCTPLWHIMYHIHPVTRKEYIKPVKRYIVAYYITRASEFTYGHNLWIYQNNYSQGDDELTRTILGML